MRCGNPEKPAVADHGSGPIADVTDRVDRAGPRVDAAEGLLKAVRDPYGPVNECQAGRSNTDMDLRAHGPGAHIQLRHGSIEAIGHPDRIGIDCQDAVGTSADRDCRVRLARIWIDVLHGVVAAVGHPDAAGPGRDRAGLVPDLDRLPDHTVHVGVDAIHCSI